MMKLIRILYILSSACLLFYVVLPNPQFPEPPSDALQSNEPADIETPERRGYYTNQSRVQVLNHYQNQLNQKSFLNLPIPIFSLNYPPEEAPILIRDQTRSTYLQEIVHPFRESYYINGFEPSDPQNLIEVNEKNWKQKIIIKYVRSHSIIRLLVTSLGLGMFWVVTNQWVKELKKLINFRKV